MLAIKARTKPLKPRLERLSSNSLTTIDPLSIVKVTPKGKRPSNLPKGPFTRITRPSTSTVTPCGITMTFRPIRDITHTPQNQGITKRYKLLRRQYLVYEPHDLSS